MNMSDVNVNVDDWRFMPYVMLNEDGSEDWRYEQVTPMDAKESWGAHGYVPETFDFTVFSNRRVGR